VKQNDEQLFVSYNWPINSVSKVLQWLSSRITYELTLILFIAKTTTNHSRILDTVLDLQVKPHKRPQQQVFWTLKRWLKRIWRDSDSKTSKKNQTYLLESISLRESNYPSISIHQSAKRISLQANDWKTSKYNDLHLLARFRSEELNTQMLTANAGLQMSYQDSYNRIAA